MDIDPKLLSSLVCPLTHGLLDYHRDHAALVSPQARLVFPIRDGAPIMIASEATALEAHPLGSNYERRNG